MIPSPVARITVLFAALAMFMAAGCASVEKPVESGEVMARKALAQFHEGDYFRALQGFKKIRDQYPFSQYSLLAELKIADCHYYLDEFDQARSAYERFEKEHPANEVIPYVVFQIIRCHASRIDTVDRDMEGAREVLLQVARLQKNFPQSPYRKAADDIAARAREVLAGHELYVARFYQRTGRTAEARLRLESLLENYPDSPSAAPARKLLASLSTPAAATP